MAKVPSVSVSQSAKLASNAAQAIFVFDGQKTAQPKEVQSQLQSLAKSKAFSGGLNTKEMIRFGTPQGNDRIFVGLGKEKTFLAENARRSGAHLLRIAQSSKAAIVHANLDTAFPKYKTSAKETLEALLQGFLLASYDFDRHKTPSKSSFSVQRLECFSSQAALKKDLSSAIKAASNVVEATFITRDWSNEPSNVGTPKYYAADSQRFAKKLGMGCKIFTEKEIKKERMNLLWSVAKGSDQPPRVVLLDYKPKASKKGQKTIVLVGKGVTFDTGGISIKPSPKMEEMKHDMTGAATMAGAIALCAMKKLPHRVVALLGFVENMPSARATQPGNIVKGRNGKTVQIDNTDAEGRLVMADLLDYAKQYKPDCLLDAATLTGAVGIALGKTHAGLMGNSDSLTKRIEAAAKKESERVWELPLADEILDDMKTAHADFSNISATRLAGTVQAGMFLKQFVPDKTDWAHLDIAYTSVDQGYLPYCPSKGGSGLHVRMLAEFIASY